MIKLYPSSAAFMQGGLVVTEHDSGCLRKILLTSKGVKGDIPKIYMEVGAVHENQHELTLKNAETVAAYMREVPIKAPVPGYEQVLYSGRADFIVDEKLKRAESAGFAPIKTIEVIHETKGTISKNTRLKVLRK